LVLFYAIFTELPFYTIFSKEALTHSAGLVEYRPMNAHPVFLMDAKAKRQPTFATSVVGFVGVLRLNRVFAE
jgi:hypothetical protein